jgi:type II secretory pathway pseudopilin PulG
LTINNRLSTIEEGRLVIEDEKKMFLCPQWWVLTRCRRGGLVLIELLMVVALLGLMTGIAMLGFGAMWGDTHFKSRAEQLVNTFQMAYEAALQSDRRYAVILDQLNNVYILRQFETLDLQTLPDDEAIITVGRFDEDFQFDYVLYDDLEDTRERGESFTEARFYAGRAGWQFGGKVVLRDREGRPWSIVIHRLGKPVQLVEGDAEILLPQTADKVPF